MSASIPQETRSDISQRDGTSLIFEYTMYLTIGAYVKIRRSRSFTSPVRLYSFHTGSHWCRAGRRGSGGVIGRVASWEGVSRGATGPKRCRPLVDRDPGYLRLAVCDHASWASGRASPCFGVP